MHKHGFTADLLKAASLILNGEQPIEEKMSSKENMNEDVTLHSTTKNYGSDNFKGEKHLDKAHDLHKKHNFKGIKFHYAMGDDMPHAVSVHKDSDAHKHPEMVKAISKIPYKSKMDSKDAKNHGIHATSLHKESVDITEDVTLHSTTKNYGSDNFKGEKHLDKAQELHQKHNFKGVKFHYAMGDDMPHAVSVHKDSDAHKHPEMHKALSKIPYKSKMDSKDAKNHGIHATSLHKESVDLDDKNVSKALKHDCATHIVHEKWGKGQCIPGMHTLVQISEEEGIVTHYDVIFDHGIEEDVSVNEMKIIKSMNHGHPKKKNK